MTNPQPSLIQAARSPQVPLAKELCWLVTPKKPVDTPSQVPYNTVFNVK